MSSRTVMVTGGGRGIGRAIALAFADPSTHIVVMGRRRETLDQTVMDICARGVTADAAVVDVSQPASVASAVAAWSTTASEVRVDVLVNNAGVGGGEPVQGSDIERWRHTLEVNLFGMYLMTRECLPLMPDDSRVINLSSVLGRFGVPGYTAYCAAKHGVIGFTRALALELAPRRITVNALVPGWVDTEMAVQGMTQGASAMDITFDEFRRRALGAVPLKRIIAPEEVALLARFLASPDASAITGQAYNICGGQTMD